MVPFFLKSPITMQPQRKLSKIIMKGIKEQNVTKAKKQRRGVRV